MASRYETRLRDAYRAFNERDIDAVISVLSPDVTWANGMEGGYVEGHNAVRDYWTRQWQQIDPKVDVVATADLSDGRVDVEVLQTVRDLSGNVLAERIVHHIYTVRGAKFSRMEIAEDAPV
jgi:hypothetical protein